jgi:hypothetical protein
MPINDTIFGSGHNIVISIGGNEVGGARSIRISQDFGVEPAHVIGTNAPVEHVPQRWSGTVNLEKFFIRKDMLGIATNMDISGPGILKTETVDIVVQDKDSGKTILRALGCTMQNSDINVQANAFTSESASFASKFIERESIGTPLMPSGL